jgi:hypothetical protein
MRIIYVNILPADLVTGGIKMTYRCAELLASNGFDTAVWQPQGTPPWLNTRANVIAGNRIALAPDDILVFPEWLNADLARLLESNPRQMKVMFCQNHYNMFSEHTEAHSLRDLGYERILCVSRITGGFISRVFGHDDVSHMPVIIDGALFRPRPKRLQIAYAPRKLRWHADLIRKTFIAKFPEMKSLPWVPIEGVPEARAAEIMGDSAIYLATGDRESCPLMPLEAMSAGCAVVGFHGYGGLEYATPDNGLWFWQDEIEETANALYRAARGVQTGDALIAGMIGAGRETAARFNADAARDALVAFFTETANKTRPPRPTPAGAPVP